MTTPHTHEHAQGEWPFADASNIQVITTRPVVDEQHPILLVSHDEDDGGWQFLCGTTNKTEDGRVGCLGCLVEADATLRDLADLPLGWTARRSGAGAPWERMKPKSGIDMLREAVQANGHQTILLPPQRPLWGLTVGLQQTYGQPEVLVFGLPPQVMFQMIETLAAMAAGGEKLTHGLRTDQVLERFECELRTIDPAWHGILLGPAMALYEGAPLTALQCTWPDKQGKLPHEEGFDDAYRRRQPQLELSDPEKAGMLPLLQAMGKA
jgi:hypothetical protein